jgi:hypothetical protein
MKKQLNLQISLVINSLGDINIKLKYLRQSYFFTNRSFEQQKISTHGPIWKRFY